MRIFIVCLLLGALVGVTPLPASAQQNQTPQQLAQEIKALKSKVSEIEKQLHTVEIVEKMELQAKLAEANAKLLNAEFAKLERDLRDSHNEWLIKWSILVLTLLTVVGAVLWFWLKSKTNQLITDEVEKNLNGFKDSLKKLDIQRNQLRESEEENAAYRLEEIHYDLNDDTRYPREIRGLREEALLDVFEDEKYSEVLRYRAAEVLTSRKSPRLISPILELLNLAVDSDADVGFGEHRLYGFVNLLGRLHTQETYEGLRKFLNRLLSENPKHKDLLLTETVRSFARVSASLDIRSSVSMLRRAIPHFENANHTALVELAGHFDIFNEPVGIKDILMQRDKDIHSGVEDKCLDALEKYDPEFAANWRAQHTTDDAES